MVSYLKQEELEENKPAKNFDESRKKKKGILRLYELVEKYFMFCSTSKLYEEARETWAYKRKGFRNFTTSSSGRGLWAIMKAYGLGRWPSFKYNSFYDGCSPMILWWVLHQPNSSLLELDVDELWPFSFKT